jgi:hypothetical protein
MPARHGTRRRYTDGCRCTDCRNANAAYQQGYRQRLVTGEDRHVYQMEHLENPDQRQSAPIVPNGTPGPVESAVTAELAGYPLSAERPGLSAVAVRLAQLLDNAKAVATYPSAVRELRRVLDALSKGAQGRRGQLSAVRTMTKKDGA